MRIAELTTYTSRLNGGVFYALTSLLPEMARANPADEFRVFGYTDPHTEEDRSAWAPVPVEDFQPWPPRIFGFSPKFYPALTRFRADILHVHGLWTYLTIAAQRVQKRAGTPVVISTHGMLDPWALGFSSKRKRIAGALFQDRLLHGSSVVHALNRAEAKSVRDYGLRCPIVVIPNGVSLPQGVVGAPPWAPNPERVLLFLSRVHPKKGLDMLIEVWPRFVRERKGERGWRLIVAGWDEIGHETELRRKVSALRIESSVEFVGPVFGAAKQAALAHADAFVLPSRSEGLPMAVLEAWSHGKPTLITTACNLPEGASEGAAIEVEPSVSGVEAGLTRLAALDDSQRQAMGEAGRRLVEKRFTWDRIAADMARVYSAVVSHEPLPAELLFPSIPGTGP